MKATLDLVLKQSLLMTNDMRFCIDILAMTALEVEQLLDEELKKNPCLDENEYDESNFSFNFMHSTSSAHDIALANTAMVKDYRDGLLDQVHQGPFNSIEIRIAEILINNLDDDGFLTEKDSVYQAIKEELFVFDEWIDSVRFRLMDFEPIGCGALSVNETLLFQAKKILRFPHQEFLDLLTELKNKPGQKITPAFLSKLKEDPKLTEIKKLNARPSLQCQPALTADAALTPDVLATKTNDTYHVSLIRKPSHRMTINHHYETLKKAKQKEIAKLKDHHKRALLLLRALTFRENNLLRVAKMVVNHQAGWFFDNEPLKPLILRDIAQALGLHESTVSRLVNGKYIFCNRGTFELKYLFSSSVKQSNNINCSANFIKEKISKLVAKEDRTNPLSDTKITELLGISGVHVSRRTVTKYRENLNINSATNRKSFLYRT